MRACAFGLAAVVATMITPSLHANEDLSPQVALDWNAIAVSTVRGATPPKAQAEGLVYMSYVQAAVYDAITVIAGRYEPYSRPAISVPPDASAEAAVVAAAYRTLLHYFPPQAATLAARYEASLAALPEAGKSAGIAVGEAAAADIIALRTGDGRDAPITFTPGPPAPGAWQFAPPPSAQSAQTPWLAFMKPFLLESPAQFRVGPPLELASDAWAEQFDEVKLLGAANSTARTAEQTAIAWFWNANVINQYNMAFRTLASERGFDLVDTARLLAMGNMVGADALIGCFDSKYHYAFWRPVTAIRSADSDGNPATVPDPEWRSLLVVPNHPEYPGAHGCVTSAEAQVFREVLGTNRIEVDILGFNPATGAIDVPGHFEKVSDLTREIVDARVWAGLHYRDSSIAGVRLGRKAARWALKRYFQPIP